MDCLLSRSNPFQISSVLSQRSMPNVSSLSRMYYVLLLRRSVSSAVQCPYGFVSPSPLPSAVVSIYKLFCRLNARGPFGPGKYHAKSTDAISLEIRTKQVRPPSPRWPKFPSLQKLCTYWEIITGEGADCSAILRPTCYGCTRPFQGNKFKPRYEVQVPQLHHGHFKRNRKHGPINARQWWRRLFDDGTSSRKRWRGSRERKMKPFLRYNLLSIQVLRTQSRGDIVGRSSWLPWFVRVSIVAGMDLVLSLVTLCLCVRTILSTHMLVHELSSRYSNNIMHKICQRRGLVSRNVPRYI